VTGPVAAYAATGLALGGATLSALAWRRARARELEAAGQTDPRLASIWRAIVRPLAYLLMPKQPRDRAPMIARLQHAGRSGEKELPFFLEEKVAGLLIGSAVGAALFFLIGYPFGALLAAACAVGGIVAPGMRLDMAASDRRALIGAALPNAIDLLMTCVDAGLSIEQAIQRVAREFARSSPALAEEFSLTANECEAGVSLTEALRRMARRIEHDDMSGLCSVVSQAHELGAPIVATLADYADSARKLRMAKLEEWAGKLAMKLIFPVAVFLLPAALVVMLGPAMAAVVQTMKGY
jgi:tight adherence protein C